VWSVAPPGPTTSRCLRSRDPVGRLLFSGRPIDLLAPPERAQRWLAHARASSCSGSPCSASSPGCGPSLRPDQQKDPPLRPGGRALTGGSGKLLWLRRSLVV